MRNSRRMIAALLTGPLLVTAASSRAASAGEGLIADPDRAGWSSWQGRVSFGGTAPVWRSGLGGFQSGGLTPQHSRGANSVALLGDYYFAQPFAAAGGFRATSGLIVGPRSELSVAQPDLAAGGLLSISSSRFGQSPKVRRGDPLNETAALPYLGLGYTGRTARGALSFSADLGLVGQMPGDAASRPFGIVQRSLDDAGRDSRLLPLLQLGMLYSF